MIGAEKFCYGLLHGETHEPIFYCASLKNLVRTYFKDQKYPWFPGVPCVMGIRENHDKPWRIYTYQELSLMYDLTQEQCGDRKLCRKPLT